MMLALNSTPVFKRHQLKQLDWGCTPSHTLAMLRSLTKTHTHTLRCPLKLPKTLLIQTFTYKFHRPLIYWGVLGWDYRYTAVVVTLPSCLKLAFIPVKNRFGRSLLILKHQLQRLRPLGDGVLRIISIVWWHLKPTTFLWNQRWKRLFIETVCLYFLWKS